MRRRFRIDYLEQLSRKNNQISSSQIDIKVGDIVFIGNDQLKRLDWPLGKITQLFPGRDGKVCVAKLKTATGELVRPVQRLYPLELSATENTEIVREIKNRIKNKQSSNSLEASPITNMRQDDLQHTKTSPHKNVETVKKDIDKETEKRSRSERKIITPAKLLQ